MLAIDLIIGGGIVMVVIMSSVSMAKKSDERMRKIEKSVSREKKS